MSKEKVQIIASDLIENWEKKEQRKKRDFMDEMINEKETLEKTVFFLLDIGSEFLKAHAEDARFADLKSFRKAYSVRGEAALKVSR